MVSGSRISVVRPKPQWVRWIVPSIADLLFVALLGLLAFTNLSVRLLGDAGIGWHIRTGQIILATHAVPRVDPFSSSMAGQPWFAWEWLYDSLVGWLESAAGLNGVVLFTALILAAVFSWTFRLLVQRGTNVALALLLVLLAASASMIHFFARPHVVSWLYTVAWFWVLEGEEPGSPPRRLLWMLPVSMLVWVNVHGGFLLGFVLLGIYWACSVWQWLRVTLRLTEERFDDVLQGIRAGRRVWTLTLTGLLSAAATLVNPYGFRLHVHIYRYLTNRFLMNHIDEFQSPNFHYVAQKCFAGLLLLTLVTVAVKGRAVQARHAFIILFSVYAGLYAARNIPVSSLLLILVIGPVLSEVMDGLGEKSATPRKTVPQPGFVSTTFLQRMKAIEMSLRGHGWAIAAIGLTCWVAASGGKLGATQRMDAHFDSKRFPEAAVNYLQQQNLPGPILSPDDWGGYFIYRLYPRMKVVVDDRHDFYGEEFLKLYLKMVHVEPDWQEFIQQHRAGLIVAPKDSALANILLETVGWQAVYRDEVAVVFLRKRT